MAGPALALIPGLLDKVAQFADKMHLSGEEKARLALEFTALQRDVIVAEAKSEHVITATWRPILMLACVAILVNNWIIAPYVSALFGVQVAVPIVEPFWKLLYIGMGGYIVGRSGEKIFRNAFNGRKDK